MACEGCSISSVTWTCLAVSSSRRFLSRASATAQRVSGWCLILQVSQTSHLQGDLWKLPHSGQTGQVRLPGPCVFWSSTKNWKTDPDSRARSSDKDAALTLFSSWRRTGNDFRAVVLLFFCLGDSDVSGRACSPRRSFNFSIASEHGML